MDNIQSLNHSKWECKYHIVFIPKYRHQILYKELRPYLGEVFRNLVRQRDSQIEEGHLMVDHVHMLTAIPPKLVLSLSKYMQCLKLLVISKARVLSIWHALMVNESATFLDNISCAERSRSIGREVILFRL